MQEIILNGRTYVKATEIAKKLGYTSDYVGQLCRSGKVDAERVGRAWYVDPDTIHAHKKTRYRSNQAKSKAAVAAYQAAQHKEISATPTMSPAALHVQVHHYEADTYDLIPTPRKSHTHTTAETASAKSEQTEPATTVKIESIAKPHQFSTERPESVHFSGAVAIVTADSEELHAPIAAADEAEKVPAPASKPVIRIRDTQLETDVMSVGSSNRHPVTIADGDESASHSTVAIATRPRKRSVVASGLTNLIALGSWVMVVGIIMLVLVGSEVVWQVSADNQIALLQFEPENIRYMFNEILDISLKR